MNDRASCPVLLLATRSAGKLRELVPLLEQAGFTAETLVDAGLPEHADEGSIEAYDSFEANALAKARWFARLAPGRIVIADDSGLTVDALDGAPGVRSKRWSRPPATLAGVELDAFNNWYLRQRLDRARGVGATSPASYVCVAAAVGPRGELVARGETAGEIIAEPRGDGGFGYDPLFASIDLSGRTFAEASRAEKASVSHRGRAFRELLRELRRVLALAGETGLPSRTPKNVQSAVDPLGQAG